MVLTAQDMRTSNRPSESVKVRWVHDPQSLPQEPDRRVDQPEGGHQSQVRGPSKSEQRSKWLKRRNINIDETL